jgi:predicted transcriptional regulator
MRKNEEKLMAEFYELKVSQVMNDKLWDLPLIQKEEPISYALSILDGKSHVWVVNNLQEKELVGVITRHDVLQILAPPRALYAMFSFAKSYFHGTIGKVEDIMTKEPIICKPDDKIVDVLQKMIRHGIRRVAVVVDRKIVGEITLRHLICKYYKASQYHPIVGDGKDDKFDSTC